MSESNFVVGNQFFADLFSESIRKANDGKGSLILLSGEAGFGKTHLLNYYHEYYKSGAKSIRSVFTEGQSPIGNFNVGNIQPLFPFSKAIEHVLEKSDITPEKRFAKNVGLTVLASMPLLGEVFYAVKEIGRDWRQFKSEKNTEKAKTVSSATSDFYDSLQALASKMPLIFLMDDMHWADSQSVELLSYIAENLNDLPIVFVVAFKKSMLDLHSLPLMSFIMNYSKNDKTSLVELDSFTYEQVGELCSHYFKNYKRTPEFEEWIHDHSYGVPGVASEYLKYFQKFPPFADDGNLAMNFKGNEFLPSTVQSVFTQHLETLSDEDRNILAVCSTEGREFTALVMSHLLNVDVLTAIKKLKTLQNKTGIIKSIGAENRYGVKTTVFKFNQAFYHNYFESSLEYEEYTSLHGQIAAFLKSKYDQTENITLREDLAPYLAAHSLESGDEETAKSMLLETAKNAQKYGSSDIIKSAFEQFKNLNISDENDNLNNLEFMQILSNTANILNSEEFNSSSLSAESALSGLDNALIDFKLYVKSITNDMIMNKYENAIDKIEVALKKLNDEITADELIQLQCLKIKCYSELRDVNKGEELIEKVSDLLKNNDNLQSKSLFFNAAAVYYGSVGNLTKSYYFLDKSANLTSKIPQELRLLTLANIAIHTKNSTPEKSAEYMRAARKLSKALNFNKLEDELARI